MKSASERYSRAAHRVQTAIAYLIGSPTYTATEPKHMRTGIDLSKAEHGALAELLIQKGVFTFDEYMEAMARGAEAEAERLQAELSEVYGQPVTTV